MPPIADRFVKDHERLETLLGRLAEDSASPDRSKLCETWSEFESALTWHLEAEERYLLPLIEAAHPAEAHVIREEHRAIRRLVAELGVLVDLHAVNEASVADLIRILHEHADREEATLYGWADQVVSTTIGRCISAMLNLAPHRVRELVAERESSSRVSHPS